MNVTRSNSTPYYQEATSATIIRLTFVTAIALVGVIGNILVCTVIISKKLRGASSMHTYLLNLAIADIGVLTIIYPLGVLRERHPSYWPFGKFSCEYLFPISDTFFGASIWFITAIALQRHQNIVKNKDIQPPRRSTKRVVCGVASIWVVSFLVLSLPLQFVFEYHEKGENVTSCAQNWQEISVIWLRVYMLVRVVFSYLVPLAVIFWTYLGIWKEIRKSILFHKHLEKESGSKNKETRRSGENTRARKILTPIVVTFALTMLPLQLYNLLSVFWSPIAKLYHIWTIHYIVVMITITNSAINPIIYSVVSKDFRKAFLQLIFKRAANKPGVQTGTFLLSRSRGSDRGMQDRNSSFNQSKKRPQPPDPQPPECSKADELQETIL